MFRTFPNIENTKIVLWDQKNMYIQKIMFCFRKRHWIDCENVFNKFCAHFSCAHKRRKNRLHRVSFKNEFLEEPSQHTMHFVTNNKNINMQKQHK